MRVAMLFGARFLFWPRVLSSFSWHFSFSWQQLQLAEASGGVPPFFLDTAIHQLYDAFGPKWFAFLSSTNELNNLTSLILRFGIWLISYHISFQKSRENREKIVKKPRKKSLKIKLKINQNVLNRPIIKNKGKSGHFGKTSIGSFSELKKYF